MNYSMGAITAAIVSFVVTAVLGTVMIPFLRRLKFGQTIKDIGPVWHKKKKQGIPTMGGLMFLIGTIAAIIVAIPFMHGKSINDFNIVVKTRFWAGLLMAIGFAFIGFFDDYIKVVKKRNLGLTAKQKMIMQALVAGSYVTSIYLADSRGATVVPFYGLVELGKWFFPLAIVVIIGTVNAVNITDGIDGLCASVTMIAATAFMICGSIVGGLMVGIAGAALAGACLGFLVWNFYPAKVIMGDVGAFFLGGMLCMLAFSLNMPVILIPIGIIYIIETMSVILQVCYFKLTKGKRLFKMSPIHHHFEMKGWSEVKIVAVFSFIALLGAAAAVSWVFFGYNLN